MRAVRIALCLWLLGPSLLTLAACTRPAEAPPPPSKPAAILPAEPDILDTSAGPVTAAAAPNARPRLRPSEEERRRRAQAPAAAPEKADFASLIGRDYEGVERLLGPADQAADMPPAKEWHYRDGSCRLVVRFYPDMKTLAYRVLSYAFVLDDGALEAPGAGSAEDLCRTRLAPRLKAER